MRKLTTHCNKGHELTPENTYILRKNSANRKPCRVCKICYKLRAKNWASKNTSRHRELARFAQLKQRGWTREAYENARIAQENRCAICGKMPPSIKGIRGKLCADHDHKTNKPRQLLCHECNLALGFFYDDELIMDKAIAYIRKWRVEN